MPPSFVGRTADGFICTSGKPMELYTSLIENIEAGAAAVRDAGDIARMIEIKVSYDTERERACHWWEALALTPEEKLSTDDPLELERLADAHPERDVLPRFGLLAAFTPNVIPAWV